MNHCLMESVIVAPCCCSLYTLSILLAVACWDSFRVVDTSRLNKLVRLAGDLVGRKLDSDSGVREKNVVKAAVCPGSDSCPLLETLVRHRSTSSDGRPQETVSDSLAPPSGSYQYCIMQSQPASTVN